MRSIYYPQREVTVVMTSFNRLELLKRTVDSFMKYNTYPIKEFIIVDDSANEDMHDSLKGLYPDFTLVLNEENIGVFESIDKVYANIQTPYIFQTEEDWDYHREGFIEKSMKVLESDPKICLVWIRDWDYLQDHPVLPKLYHAEDVPFHLLGDGEYWHGWSGAPGLRRLSDYKLIAPYCQWSKKTDRMTVRECMIDNAFWRLGFKSALLLDGYITHTGGGQSTRDE